MVLNFNSKTKNKSSSIFITNGIGNYQNGRKIVRNDYFKHK